MKRTKKRQKRTFPSTLAIVILVVASFALVMLSSNERQRNTEPRRTNISPPSTVMPGEDPSLVLRDLVQSHPHAWICSTFDSLVRAGDIFLNFQPLSMVVDGIATFTIVDIQGHGHSPVFNINVDELMNPTIPDEFKQLAIFHEFIHYLQFERGIVPEQNFYYRERADTLSEAEALEIFEVECQAYLHESKLACELGWSGYFDICAVYCSDGLLPMRQRVAERYSAFPLFQPYVSALMNQSADTTRMLAGI